MEDARARISYIESERGLAISLPRIDPRTGALPGAGGVTQRQGPLHDPLLNYGPGRRGWLLLPRGEPAMHGRAGALERGGHRLLSGVENVRRLPGVESDDIAEDQGGTLTRWQKLKSGYECKRDGFLSLVTFLWARSTVAE